MKASDWALVKQINAQVQQLPDLKIPPEKAYIILETDGSMTGWGGVCKWKPKKANPRNMEKIGGKLRDLSSISRGRFGGSTQFPLLTEYEDFIHDTVKIIIFPEEHQKRHRMKEIEDQAIRNASLALNELELIQPMKEYDFNHRRHLDGGRQLLDREAPNYSRDTKRPLEGIQCLT
ncbi:hypothetical protein ZIOFF_050792 [Zingiber officinale]|uniref:Reverse transcriptase/retrotransposon-derived protein RNase H-like domain-containing protein n=1 Tax=Zingiber officinale TaxID=94328 RepID=A0A8J5G161_ZINOF|nr:hypothetical protein ZIOFF_050792 [Zingiber officinale]